MNWQHTIENLHKVDRQRLIRVAHLASCWHTAPSSGFDIARGALYEPADNTLLILELKFSASVFECVALWEELHWYGAAKNFSRSQKSALITLIKIQSYA